MEEFEEFHLLKRQRNEIFERIRALGFEAMQFQWSPGLLSGDEVVAPPRLTHVPSGYSIDFLRIRRHGYPSEHWHVAFSPGASFQIDSKDCRHFFPDVMVVTQGWLNNLKHEIETPDLWALAAEQRQQLEEATGSDTANTPFTLQEQQYIANKLDELKALLVENHQLQGQQVNLLEDQFEFLKQESQTQGRRSWIQMALGTIASCICLPLDLPAQALARVAH